MEPRKEPVWVIREVTRIRGTEDYSTDAARAYCDRCGAPLFAELWHIENTIEKKMHVVGSTCVKALTGQTITQLRAGYASFVMGCSEDEEEKKVAVRRTQFFQANETEMAWLDSHIERVHRAAEKRLAAWRESGSKIGEFPPLPSSEFWESLRTQAHDKGVLSDKQMDALRREMAVNHEAALPDIKTKGVFEGKITGVQLTEKSDRFPWKIRVALRSEDGIIIHVQLNEGTVLTMSVLKAFGITEDIEYRRSLELNRALQMSLGKKMAVKGTVKAQAAVGGKVYLTRSSLVSLETEGVKA